MNWQLLAPLLVTTVVAMAGWYAVHLLQSARDRATKRRETRVAYLIEAYRRLESVCHRQPLGPEDAKKIESAISDIQLFGTLSQVRLARTFVSGYASQRTFDIDALLADLRIDLRRDLGLAQTGERTFFLRIWWDDPTTRTDPPSDDKHPQVWGCSSSIATTVPARLDGTQQA